MVQDDVILDDDFLIEAAEGMPTEGGFERKYNHLWEMVWFQTDPNFKDHQGVPQVQLCVSGPKLDDEGNVLEGNPRTEKFSIGSGFALLDPSEPDAKGIQKAAAVKSTENYLKFSGQSLVGRFLKDIQEKWEKTEENENKHVYEVGDTVLKLSPTGYRLYRWLKMNGKRPNWMQSSTYEGIAVSYDADKYRLRTQKADEPDKERTFPVALFALQGEVPIGQAGKVDAAAKTQATTAPAAKKETTKATTSKAKATTTPKAEPAPEPEPVAVGTDAGEAIDFGDGPVDASQIEAYKEQVLKPLALAIGDYETWRTAVVQMPAVQKTTPIMMLVLKPETYEALRA